MNALKFRPFVAYFVVNTMSLLGTWIQKIGLGWLTWQITESTFWTSFVSVALMAPVGILSPFIAVYAELWDMRKAMMATKVLMIIIGLVVFILQIFEMHNLQTLVVLSLMLGLLSAFHHPIRLVFISIVVPKAYLASAIGMNSVSWNMSRVVGPGIAGFAIAGLGLAPTFGIALLLYVPLVVILFWLPLFSRSNSKQEEHKFLALLFQGGIVALQTPLIFMALCLVALNSFFVRGVLEIQPAIIGQLFGGDSYLLAAATASAGVGAVAASVWIGVGKTQSDFIRRCLMPMLTLGMCATLCLNFSNNIVIMCFAFVVCGLTTTVVGIGAQTLIQLEVPDNYRARVMTWWSTVSFGGLTLGGIAIGLLGEYWPIESAIFGLVLPALFLILLVYIQLPLSRPSLDLSKPQDSAST